MSDFFDKNEELEQSTDTDIVKENDDIGEVEDDILNINEDESTVFSAPLEHKDKKVLSGGKKRLLSFIAVLLSVAVLACGTWAVIKFIPKLKQEETPISDFLQSVEVISNFDITSNNVLPTKIIVKNAHGDFTLVYKKSESGGTGEGTNYYWTVDSVDHAKLSVDKLNSIASSAGSVNAIRTVERSVDECGFSNPKVKFTVQKSNDTSYTVIIGNKSVDGLGYYMTVENSNKVHVVQESAFENFEFSLLDLSDTTAIPKTIFSSDTSENIVADGTYAYFDSLTLSGKLYPEKITIVNNKQENKTAEIVPYLITTPMERYADSQVLAPLVNIFSKPTSVTGNCALDINDETLKRFGLDNPDAIVTMTINGEPKTFKFAIVKEDDEEYCAIVYDGATMIRKANVSDFAFLTTTPETYYYKSLFMYSINDLTSLVIKSQDSNLVFNIDNHGGTANTNNPYTATVNGLDVSNALLGYYNDFTCIQGSSFEISEVAAEADATVTFNFTDESKVEIALYRANANEYQYSINGIMMGKIPSSEYNKMLSNFDAISKGQSVKP